MTATTLKDVAGRAGVSRSAVSRTFTGGASVSAKTRAKVEKAAKQSPTVLAGERLLDVAGRKSAGVKLDRQVLDRSRAAFEMRPQRRDEGLSHVSELRRRILQHPLRRRQPPRSNPVAIARRRALGPLVAFASQGLAHFRLQRLLDDQPGLPPRRPAGLP